MERMGGEFDIHFVKTVLSLTAVRSEFDSGLDT